MEIKTGDYLLTKENELYRIIDIYNDTTGSYFDIKSMRCVDSLIISDAYITMPREKPIPRLLKSVPRNVLRHMGKIIPEEKATKILKILYG